MAVPADGLTLNITRVLGARPPVVYAAFSHADQLAAWWGPTGFTTPSLQFDPEVGRRYRIRMQPPDGEAFYLTGEFREVDPPHRLAYTFVWEDPAADDVETLVVLSFRPVAGSTEVSLTQGPFKTEARRALHLGGWTDGFNKLAGLFPG